MIMTQAEMERLDPEARRLLAAYDKEQYTSLLAEVDELSKRGPLSPGLLGLAAASLVVMERYEEAVTAARGAVEREPRWAWLHLALSRAEGGLGNWPKAVEAGRTAMQILPGEPVYLANLSACQREAGQADLAVRTARQALALDPAHPEGLNQLGLALEAGGDTRGALEQFRKAQAAQPDSPAAYLNEGMLHRRAGRTSESRRAFQQALRLEQGRTEAEDRLAESLSDSPVVRRTILHLVNLARLSVVGWAIVAFFYYLFFRLLEFLWKFAGSMLPVGRTLLVVTLLWLLGGAAMGRVLRLWLRRARF